MHRTSCVRRSRPFRAIWSCCSDHPDLLPTERDEALTEAEREAIGWPASSLTCWHSPVPMRRITLSAPSSGSRRYSSGCIRQTARRLARGQKFALELVRDRCGWWATRSPEAIAAHPARQCAQVYTVRRAHHRRVALARVPLLMLTVLIRASALMPLDLPHVFERFYRADPARSRDPGGTGLGLAIARWIARQHGGDVILASTPGRGTTACVRLPVSMPQLQSRFSQDSIQAQQHISS